MINIPFIALTLLGLLIAYILYKRLKKKFFYKRAAKEVSDNIEFMSSPTMQELQKEIFENKHISLELADFERLQEVFESASQYAVENDYKKDLADFTALRKRINTQVKYQTNVYL